MPLVEIDRDGDVTLKLSKGSKSLDDEETSILVSSKVLALASRVFSAMLGPRFLEGQRSASGTLAPIPLPDDDADAVTTLCHILHFNHYALPDKPELELFKNLALLCDKYDCVTPLKFVAEHWLLLWKDATLPMEIQTLLFISYVFDRPERFSIMSMRIIREFSGGLSHLDILEQFDIIPEAVLSGLNRQRKLTLQKIERSVAHQMELMEQSCALTFTDPSSRKYCSRCFKPIEAYCMNCRAAAESQLCSIESRKGVYIGFLKKATLDPVRLWATMTTNSITSIAHYLQTAAREASNKHACTGISKGCPVISSLWSLKTDVDGVNGVATLTRGLCLDCIKAGRETVSLEMEQPDKSFCRVDHGQVYTSL